MGLDMYLYKKTYVKNWDHMAPEERHQVTVLKGGKPTAIKPERVYEIVEEIAVWRKANAIHRWFVEHVQGGKDECQESAVSIEQLRELLHACNTVLNTSRLRRGRVVNGYKYKDGKRVPNYEEGKIIEDSSVAETVLPTQFGFFFGSMEYDGFYIQDLQYTKQVLEEAIKEGGDYYYRASW